MLSVILHGAVVKPAGGRAYDGGVLRLAILVDSILPRCPCMIVEGTNTIVVSGYQMRFPLMLMGCETGRRGVPFSQQRVLSAAMMEEDNDALRRNDRNFPR